MTPFQLLTGVKMRTKQDLEILKLLEEEIVETFTENREKIREEAKRNILKMQGRNYSPLVSMEKKEISTAADSVRSGWPLWNRLWSRHPIESLNETKPAVFARRRS
ncbi:hypothetical protein TNCV_3012841 [Trichonephila clavipes]|nr:hypothetical protein TNCV_3012841 [Trichonephila clavipes]